MTEPDDQAWTPLNEKSQFTRFGPDDRSALAAEYPRLFELIADDETAIVYWPHRRAFGLPVLDGGSSIVQIDFDPWSGKPLPTDLGDVWFDELTSLGVDPMHDDIPAAFQTEAWWLEREL